MADGTIKIGIELDDTGVARKAQVEGKKAGEMFSEGFEGSSKDVGNKADSAIKGAGKNAKSAGSSAGKDYASGFDSQSKNLGDKVDSAIDSAGSGAKSAGKEAGREYASGFESETKDIGSDIDFGGSMGKFSGAAGVAAGAVGIFAGAVAAVGAAGAELVSIANDVGEDMGKLATAAETNATSWDDAHDTYRDMVGILGEVDQSVEATNHMLVMAQGNTEQLAEWTDIAAGVYATFGDSLPIEGLTEAANETMRVGQVVGPMADALNWASLSTEEWTAALEGHEPAQTAFREALEQGMSVEDAFNAALAECNDEQERGEIITSALSAAYYDAAEAYKENNKNIIEFRQAQSDLNETLAEAGELLMPLGSTLLTGFSDALQGVMDKAKEVGPQLKDAFSSGDYDAGGEIVANLVSDMIVALPEKLPEFIEAGSGFFRGFISGLVERLPEMLSSLGTALLDSSGVLMESATQLMNDIAEKIPELAQQLVDSMPTVVQMIADKIIEYAPSLLQAGINLIIQLAIGIITAAPVVLASVVSLLAQIIASVAQWVAEMAAKAVEAGLAFLSGVVQSLSQLPSQVAGFLSSVISSVAQWASDMAAKAIEAGQNFLSGVQGKFSEVVSFFSGIPSQILGALGDLGSLLWSAGQSVVQGFKDGISAAWSGVTGFISGLASSISIPLPFSAAPVAYSSGVSALSVSAPENGGAPGAMPLASASLSGSVPELLASTIGSVGDQISATFKGGRMANVIKVETSSPSYEYNLSIDGMSKYGKEQVWQYVYDMLSVMRREGAM